MPKAIISPDKGLVQSSGSGFGVAASHNGYGVYQFAKEIDVGGLAAPTVNTNKQHLLSICTLPASSVVTRCYIMTTEACSAVASTLVDIAAISDDVDTYKAVDATAEVEILADADINAAAVGAHFASVFSAGTSSFAADIGAATNILLRSGATIPATALTTGKFMVFIEFIGSGPATDLATLKV